MTQESLRTMLQRREELSRLLDRQQAYLSGCQAALDRIKSTQAEMRALAAHWQSEIDQRWHKLRDSGVEKNSSATRA